MDEIARAYSLLSSIKENLPKTYEVDQQWVEDFHAAVDKIESATGLDLEDFRLSHGESRRETTGGNYLTGEVFYSGRMVVERTRFMSKLDALLTYFTFQGEKSTKKQVGFSR